MGSQQNQHSVTPVTGLCDDDDDDDGTPMNIDPPSSLTQPLHPPSNCFENDSPTSSNDLESLYEPHHGPNYVSCESSVDLSASLNPINFKPPDDAGAGTSAKNNSTSAIDR